MPRSKQELRHVLDQYSRDATKGGLADVINKLLLAGGRDGMTANEIAIGLFPHLPADEQSVLGDIINDEVLPEMRRNRQTALKLAAKVEQSADDRNALVNRDTRDNRGTSNPDLKAFVAALAWRTPKERAAAWRRLTPEECAAAWSLLTSQQRKADGEALATAWIEEIDDPDTKRRRAEHVDVTNGLRAEGQIVETGRRDGQVVSTAAGHLSPEEIERLLDGPVKQRALGANAFERGRPIADNPHPTDAPEHRDWDFGYRTARDLELGDRS
jgi:hypothetical protein